MAFIYVNPTAATNGSGSEASPRNIWPTSISTSDTIALRAGTRLLSTSQLTLGAGSNVIVTRYGPATDPDPILTVQAGNFGSINVDRPGVHTFDHIHFDAFTGAANGGGLLANQVSAGAAAELVVQNCKFTNMQWNAIRLHGTSTNAAPTFRCVNTTFDMIGEDAIYGGAVDYEVTDCRATRVGRTTSTGDPIGYIDATPTRVYIARNYFDKSDGDDTKQVIIIDSLAVSGLCIIEDNELIGYGDETTQAIVHSVIISKVPSIVRRNRIVTAGLAYGFVGSNCEFSSNVVQIRNARSTAPTIALTGDNGKVYNNVFASTQALSPEQKIVTQGSGYSGNVVHNNIFANVPIAIASDNVGVNVTATHNLFFNVTQQRRDSTGAPFAGGSDVVGDPLFRNPSAPWDGLRRETPARRAGKYIAGLRDYDGRRFTDWHIGPWASLPRL